MQFDIEKQFKVKFSYTKARKVREAVLESVRGFFKESYGMLLSYCYQLESINVGINTRIKTDD